jgi:molybdopterin-containing oxidoreductase family iron-sulfur binding subunit
MPPVGRRPLPILGQESEAADTGGQWRSLAERAARGAGATTEFAAEAASWVPSRREFVQLLGASAALAGLGGCLKQPDEKILPYTRQPEEVVPGRPLHYATASMLGGRATGLLVTASEGHPTKVEGNPQHPSSLGSSGVFEQASVLQLYDPQRAGVVLYNGKPRSYREFLAAQHAKALALRAKDGGAGLRFLLEPTSSPLLADLRRRLAEQFPQARFQSWSAINDDAAYEGTRIAFGAPYDCRYDLGKAKVIACLGADPLSATPGNLVHMRGWAEGREPDKEMNRLYAVESTLTVTGMSADHRLRVRPSQMVRVALALAARVGGPLARLQAASGKAALDPGQQKFVDALARDLSRAGRSAVVIAGPQQPAAVQALAHAINSALGSEVPVLHKPLLLDTQSGPEGLRALAEEIRGGKIDTLVVTAWNPVHGAPFDLNFREALGSVPNSIYRGLFQDETAERSTWFVPATHPLEDWGDGRAHDGTVSFVQPLISPLFNGIGEAQVLGAFFGEGDKTTYGMLRDYWQKRGLGGDFETGWEKAIHDGMVAGTAAPKESPALRADALSAAIDKERFDAAPPGLELQVIPDYRIWDGRFANNVWLQEMPDPVTKATWENAALLSAKTAAELHVETHDLVDLGLRGPPVHAPVYVLPGQADGVVTVAMGYGRRGGEQLASGIGFDVAPLRRTDAYFAARGLTFVKTGRKHQLAITQEHWSMEGRDPAIVTTKDKLKEDTRIEKQREPLPTMHTPWDYSKMEYRWGLGIDLGKCTGCSACLVACQSENNVPVVGKINVAKSREMHWLRLDRYFDGDEENPTAVTQPMMCVHCETAPCEYVCPVNATVHSDEGLNEMVYNRCIGTRYCSNNCPYKVRRFNYFDYTYDTVDIEKLHMNPDVTVRSRGVMEKCTYCVQRIERARIDTRIAGRHIADGDVQTACQQACPASAIVFGNLNEKESKVAKVHGDERHYYVLHELGTRPRTAYLARVRNPNPELA